jgi:tetratricopeptide (TPR) repeat protein
MNKRTLKKLYQAHYHAKEMMHCLELDEARHLFILTAQKGYRPSMVKLGMIYYMGRGVEPDIVKALHWFRLAADKGSRAACLNYAHGCCTYALINQEKASLFNERAWEYYSRVAKKDGRYYFFLGLMCFEGRFGIDNETQHHLKASMLFFAEALSHGNPEAALYLWRISEMRGEPNEEYYHDGERILEQQGTVRDFNNWSYSLCQWGEYKKALPFIEECLRMEPDDVKDPNYLDTYGECLYGLGRKKESKKVFEESLYIYQRRDERKSIRDTQDKITRLFGSPKSLPGVEYK